MRQRELIHKETSIEKKASVKKERPAGGNASSSRPAGGDASSSRPAGGNASSSRPTGGNVSNSRPAGGDASSSRPAGGDASSSRPAGGDASSSRDTAIKNNEKAVSNSNDGANKEAIRVPAILEIGDAVWITSLRRVGIISELADSRGIVEVMIQGQRVKINRKRLKPYIKKEELYPEDYDMDIVFDSKENRKKRKLMSKRHVEGLSIERDRGN
ncbi:hypothetical protein D3C73_976110 [compost metagenome]